MHNGAVSYKFLLLMQIDEHKIEKSTQKQADKNATRKKSPDL